jgi:hypothetical protein
MDEIRYLSGDRVEWPLQCLNCRSENLSPEFENAIFICDDCHYRSSDRQLHEDRERRARESLENTVATPMVEWVERNTPRVESIERRGDEIDPHVRTSFQDNTALLRDDREQDFNVATPARIMIAPVGTETLHIRNIIGPPPRYSPIRPWKDLGATKSGVLIQYGTHKGTLSFQLSETKFEIHTQINKELMMAILIKPGTAIRCYLLDRIKFNSFIEPEINRGEAYIWPVKFNIFGGGRYLEKISDNS